MNFSIVGYNLGKGIVKDIAKQGLQAIAFTEYFARKGCVFKSADQIVPFLHQVANVFVELFDGNAFAYGSDDDTEVVWADAIGEVFQSGFFFGVANFPADRDGILEGDEDKIASGNGDIAGNLRAFVGDGFFDNLNEQGLTGFKDLSYFSGFNDGFFDGKLIEVGRARMTSDSRFDHLSQGC